MDKVIEIDGKKVGFRASALTPRMYRHTIGRDIIKDMNQLCKSFVEANSLPKDATEEEKNESILSDLDLEIFENVAYIMAKQYDTSLPSSPHEWLDKFSMFSVYEVLPEILNLWTSNNATIAKPKKKQTVKKVAGN